jgi:pyruvate carboxylase
MPSTAASSATCRLLPTSPFFYGLLDREEVAIDIDTGKTLVVRQTGRSDTVDEEGKIKVFFELNGQPRAVRVHKAGLGAVKAKPKAEEANPKHVGAPMPGMVVTVAVKVGSKSEQKVTPCCRWKP